jgi:multicomponent Na+:H+ antiporter subunit C
MEIVLSLFVGILYGTGVYFLLRRSLVKIIVGIIFLGNATNLLLFVSGGLTNIKPAFLDNKAGPLADPLPQALILTAIVIGFGIIAFTLVLKYRFHQETGTEDIDQVKNEMKE